MNSLFDLPIACHPNPNNRPSHIPPRSAIQAVESALRTFREQLPTIFTYRPLSEHLNGSGSISPDGTILESYDSFNDPWFVLLHANLYTAEMMMWKEMTHYESAAYDRAVGCARAMVVFIRHMRPEHWIHVGMFPLISHKSCNHLTNRHDGSTRHIPLLSILIQRIRSTPSPRRIRPSSKCK